MVSSGAASRLARLPAPVSSRRAVAASATSKRPAVRRRRSSQGAAAADVQAVEQQAGAPAVAAVAEPQPPHKEGQQLTDGPTVQQPQAPSSAQPAAALVTTTTLAPQTSLAAAVAALRAAVLALPSSAGAYPSGLARLEVPLPQGTRALWWLRGQLSATTDSAALLHPRIYFSPRRTNAADTDGSAAAGAAAAGAGSVAGAGAAWLWRGSPGEPLGEEVVRDMQRFLGASGPGAQRVRAFGGARFNTAQQPGEEWAEFGSYCFLIPRIEFLEAAGCCILACTVAWDAASHGSSLGHASNGSSNDSSGTQGSPAVGFASLDAAVMDAVAALDAVQLPAPPAAGAFKLRRLGSSHTPDEAGWHTLMDGTHAELSAAAAAAAAQQAAAAPPPSEEQALDACTPLLRVSPEAAREEYLLNGQEGLDDLLAALEGGFEATATPPDAGGLTKVVLARRTDVAIEGRVEPLALLEALQERDPRAYQIMLQMPSGTAFLGSTPECLYTRTGTAVASEAVAGTRARGAGGDVEQDFWLAFDLLRSHKDHVEFTVVRDWVQQALAGVCDRVSVDVAKSVLKQGAVQHLYGKLSAQLKPGASDAHLLAALHPTPAVCGRPREDALGFLAASEPFDRGYYAGPFGWVSQGAAEFVVAIRSALVRHDAAGTGAEGATAAAAAAAAGQLSERLASHAAAGPGPLSSAGVVAAAASTSWSVPSATGMAAQAAAEASSGSSGTSVSLFAGVGIVRGSDTASEWAELDLKIRQYERLLQGVPPLAASPNVNALWARLLVEELCRLGCNTFCVAPGSRSSPLTVAVAQHPRARIVPCIDERSLGFWALGYGRAAGRPAVVITSSGTAVANLLPAVVEASQSGVPLLLVTGDRPAELRDTGANQTIDQVKMFGGYTRWHADLPAPLDALPARTLLSAVDTAVQYAAAGLPPGPVHLNFQFREPLAPVDVGEWDRACLQGLQHWEAGDAPFTTAAGLQHTPHSSSSGNLGSSLLGSSSFGGASGLAADPAAQAVLQTLLGARRGLIVAAELTSPEDVVAAAQLSQLLGWPVAADVLSGLRAGVPAAGAAASTAGPAGPAVVHHMDNLLLLDRQQWGALRPDVVMQLGGHLTSKRVGQFLEWCCLEGEGQAGAGSSGSDASGAGAAAAPQRPLQWVLMDRSPKRHDQFALLSHRLQAPLPALVAALAAALGAAAAAGAAQHAAQQAQRQEQARYCRLLQLLDAEASAAVDAALAAMPELTEPAVARVLSQQLPPGEGLFVGNSMPIRDLDMYAAPAPPAGASLTSSAAAAGGMPGGPTALQGVVPVPLGARVAANRGASGIDGVLSTAAGFADGLGRAATLVVGDLSFLHDINGLNLLRSGEARPPLTVVLVNNGGGGIFSFLPIAQALPEDVFTPLWATPQHVDLEGMCRAHGIPHQRVTGVEDLGIALRSAWGCNRHSVIEVVTSRHTNVQRHREVQDAVKQAVSRALALLDSLSAGTAGTAGAADAAAAAGQGASSAAGAAPFELTVHSASYHAFSLPLAKLLTTAAGGEEQRRRGFLLRLWLAGPGGASLAHGVGEVAPLPGLHRESPEEAEAQLALLCQLLSADGPSSAAPGGSSNGSVVGPESVAGASGSAVTVPLTAALLGGRLSAWLQQRLGVQPGSLLPSVRCGLEAALLSAIAQHQGMPLAQLLAGPAAALPPAVGINGLLDCQGTPEEAAAEAAALLQQQPYAALKIKVGRRADPLADAAAVVAIRQAVGPEVVLRADANRRWTLEQAVQFGKAAAAAQLQYIEEPVASPADLPEFHHRTGMPVALDESVDEGLVGPSAPDADALCEGAAALVLKPAVLGGFERTAQLAAWAALRGMHAVVSSAFESSLGLSQLAQLAAALEATPGAHATQHGLATLSWFAEDPLPADGSAQLLQPGASSGSMAVSLAAAQAVSSSAMSLALALDQQAASAGQDRMPRPQLRRRSCTVQTASASYALSLLEAVPGSPASSNGSSSNGSSTNGAAEQPPVLLLHGFMGGADDWRPLMQSLGLQHRCVALDLPGHGATGVTASSSNGNGSSNSSSSQEAYSLEAAAEAVAALVQQEGLAGCQLVGYSLGARLALLLAARWPKLFSGVVSVSGTPGLPDPAACAERAARDDALAAALRTGGLPTFLDHWYQQPMWALLRASPRFEAMLQQRRAAGDATQLAAVLATASPGRAPSVWQELEAAAAAGTLPPLLLVAGQADAKFVGIAEKLAARLAAAGSPTGSTDEEEEGDWHAAQLPLASGDSGADALMGGGASVEVALLPGCGHAPHIERPVELLAALQRFFGSG